MCDDHLDTFTFFSSVIITPEISYVKMIYKIHGKKFVTLLLVSQAEKTNGFNMNTRRQTGREY